LSLLSTYLFFHKHKYFDFINSFPIGKSSKKIKKSIANDFKYGIIKLVPYIMEQIPENTAVIKGIKKGRKIK